jgi:uncharacterized membrane protein
VTSLEGWVTDFKPSTIASLAPGNFQTLEVDVKPAINTADGNYRITIVANSNEVRRVMDMWVNVKSPNNLWLWIGGAILVVVVAGFVLIYLRYGRHL